MQRSKIGWTDFSGGNANFVLRGRTAGDCEVSPGCAHCYAGAILRRNSQTPEVTTHYPAKLARLARAKFVPDATPFRRGPGSRPMVFVCDMGDLFHEAVPDTFIERALDTLNDRQDVDWQVLTKRPERMATIAQAIGWPANVWAGVTVEDQPRADERIPLLLQVPARVRFLSMEPLLGAVGLTRIVVNQGPVNVLNRASVFAPALHWVIVGGESGPKFRPFNLDWARDLRDQCQAAGVAFFFKQGSALRPGQDDVLDGQTHKAFPA